MATVLPPVRNDISGAAPNPSNAVARTAFGLLHDYLMNLLGSAGSPAAARTALGIPDGIGKNKIINSNFAINQLSLSGTVTLTAGVYGHDGFKAGLGGCTYTFATALNVTTLTITAGTLQQVIEGFYLSSSTHTLSWVGTATARIDSGSYSASGITGTAVGGTNQTCEWGTGTVSKVQYEQGALPTTFEFRQQPLDLLFCQRQYFKKRAEVMGFSTASGQQISAHVSFPTPMLATPTMTLTRVATSAGVAATTAGSTVTVDGFTPFALSTGVTNTASFTDDIIAASRL